MEAGGYEVHFLVPDDQGESAYMAKKRHDELPMGEAVGIATGILGSGLALFSSWAPFATDKSSSALVQRVGAFFDELTLKTFDNKGLSNEYLEYDYDRYGTRLEGNGLNVQAALLVAALSVMTYMAYRMWSARGASWKFQKTRLWQLCVAAVRNIREVCSYVTATTLIWVRSKPSAASAAPQGVTVLELSPAEAGAVVVVRVDEVVPIGTGDDMDAALNEVTTEAVVIADVVQLPLEDMALEHVRLWLEDFRADWELPDDGFFQPYSFVTRLLEFSEVMTSLQKSVEGSYDLLVLLYTVEDMKHIKTRDTPIVTMNVHEWGLNAVNRMVDPEAIDPKKRLGTALQRLVITITNLLDADKMLSADEYSHVPVQMQHEFRRWTPTLEITQKRTRFWKWASVMAHFMHVVPQLMMNTQATYKETQLMALSDVRALAVVPKLTPAILVEELQNVATSDAAESMLEVIGKRGGIGGLFFPMAGFHQGNRFTEGLSLNTANTNRGTGGNVYALRRPKGNLTGNQR